MVSTCSVVNAIERIVCSIYKGDEIELSSPLFYPKISSP